MDRNILKIASIIGESIVDGPGLRLVVFTQGCPHHCPGCHNPETHDPEGGREITISEILDMYAENPLLSGITFSGGEPFLQAAKLALLARQVHELGGNVITYTGYWFEDLSSGSLENRASCLLEETDLLVDGPYISNLRNLGLRFRGSSNQRLLNHTARKAIKQRMHNLFPDCKPY